MNDLAQREFSLGVPEKLKAGQVERFSGTRKTPTSGCARPDLASARDQNRAQGGGRFAKSADCAHLRCKDTFECWLGYRRRHAAAGRICRTTRGARMTELEPQFLAPTRLSTGPVFRLAGFYRWRSGSSSILLLSRSLFLTYRCGLRRVRSILVCN
jgi:hypothetical protein